jgi:hypothetical protein
MYKKMIFLGLVLAAFHCPVISQTLLPAINSGILPSDNDSICDYPPFTGSFETNGYAQNDTIPQFTLFDKNGSAFDISTELQNGKPVLLIAGSITCPVFRNKVATINDVISTYGNSIRTVIVYTIEAHPTDPSPYSGQVNITQQNIDENILYPQPVTYLERKNMVDSLLNLMTVFAPIFIDGPCNEWWLNFGPAPNNAYLIDTNGIIFSKHAWLDEYPKDIFCDIDSILGISGNCSSAPATGTFYLNIIDTMATGPAGTVLYTHAEIINNTTEDAVVIVMKLQENYAAGWDASFCINGVCYVTSLDSTTVLVPANDTISFSADFFTSAIPDSSNLKVGFRNQNMPSNQFAFRFFASTYDELSITEYANAISRIFPNPSNDAEFNFKFAESLNEDAMLFIYDITGKSVYAEKLPKNSLSVKVQTGLKNGIYWFNLIGNERSLSCGKLVIQN